ncbi:MerR family DNA-binding transcriptional regulator, partial [Streptomyces sp. NPDC001817]|uniref:MerR family DNA-binding transcriptional regulator n=1 Tax=Streptomyces sp. NPDC001817 TaxID=3154398 RepID=UPI0033174B1D
MRRNPQNGGRLRPVDLARRHGLSTQAVRNYEEAGILPTADRTPHGYRTYTSLHAGALRAFLALVPGHGHQTATSIMRAVNKGAVDGGVGPKERRRPPQPEGPASHPAPRGGPRGRGT